jgi:beta-N-acetylhexosaminidase
MPDSTETDTYRMQLAHRCVFGFDAEQFQEGTAAYRLSRLNPLGYIFFRAAFDACTDVAAIQSLLKRVMQHHTHPLFLGLDQEGGQVERLPATLFPGLASPYALGQAWQTGLHDCVHDHYTLLANGLATLGFNLNFFPTLDVHQTPKNPIIGNRSFSESPETVYACGHIAIKAQHQAGIQSVLKHYPGHGNGTIDSHHALPDLIYSPEEEHNFLRLASSDNPKNPPWVMLAHGAYAHLQKRPRFPASCDETIIQRLRQKGFQGVTITDDLDMRGILDAFPGSETQQQLQACITALNAGVDVLLFRGAGLREEAILNGLTDALMNGTLNPETHTQSMQRVQCSVNTMKQACTAETFPHATPVSTEVQNQWQEQAFQLHQAIQPAVCKPLSDYLKQRTMAHEAPFGHIDLYVPERAVLPHYCMDAPDHADFRRWLETSSELPVTLRVYTDSTPDEALKALRHTTNKAENTSEVKKTLYLGVVWLPKVGLAWHEALMSSSEAGRTFWLLNLGSPVETSSVLNIAGWRPLQQQAFAHYIGQQLLNTVKANT